MRTYNVAECEIVDLPVVHNSEGNINVLQNQKDVPFDVRRIYYLYDVPYGSERGGHAHYNLQQYIIAASGSFTFVLDDGVHKREIFLNSPQKALHIYPGIWREMNGFSSGSICLVLASLTYSEEDYIRDYDEFLKFRTQITHDL